MTDNTFAALQAPDFLKLLAHDIRWRLVQALSQSDYRGQELARMLTQPQNLISYHLRQLRQQRLVTEHRSTADARDVYFSLDLDRMAELYAGTGEALHPALGCFETPAGTSPESFNRPPLRVLFLCTHNSARSQMAEGILRHLGGQGVEVYSAGSQPGGVHPHAVRALAAAGIDIGQQRSKSLDQFLGQTFDHVITVCDRVREVCPVFPDDPECLHWSFPDPATVEGPDEVRYRAFQETARKLTTRISYFLTTVEHQRGKVVKK